MNAAQPSGGNIVTAKRQRIRRKPGPKPTGASVDAVVDGAVAMIVSLATEGLISAGRYTETRAKHYAPVRDIFSDTRGVTKRNRFTVGGLLSQGASPGVATKRGVYIRTPEQMDRFRRSRPHSWEVGDSGFRGATNSYRPVVREKAKGREFRAGGDFRLLEAGPDGPQLASVMAVSARKGQRRQSNYGQVSAGRFLSSAGRYELRSGRAFFSQQGDPDNPRRVRNLGRAAVQESATIEEVRTRLGGRLRGEIYMTPPARRGDTVWVWVVSPTPYARYQEFGTRHNRASPFLRPALYEARRFLPAAIKSAFRSGRRVSPRFKTGILSVGR